MVSCVFPLTLERASKRRLIAFAKARLYSAEQREMVYYTRGFLEFFVSIGDFCCVEMKVERRLKCFARYFVSLYTAELMLLF